MRFLLLAVLAHSANAIARDVFAKSSMASPTAFAIPFDSANWDTSNARLDLIDENNAVPIYRSNGYLRSKATYSAPVEVTADIKAEGSGAPEVITMSLFSATAERYTKFSLNTGLFGGKYFSCELDYDKTPTWRLPTSNQLNNEWHKVGMKATADGKMEYYVNDVKVCTHTLSGSESGPIQFLAALSDMRVKNVHVAEGDPTPSPTPSPTPATATVSAIEDPHLTNIRGEHFDVWKLGRVQLLRAPLSATEDTADFVISGVIRNTTSDWAAKSCSSPYITEFHMTGRSFFKAVVVRLSGPGRIQTVMGDSHVQFGVERVGIFDGHPIVCRTPDKDVMVNGKTSHKANAVELVVGSGTIHFTAGKAHLNMVADNLAMFGQHFGGLLGEDDHSEFSKLPETCHSSRTIKGVMFNSLPNGFTGKVSYSA